MFCPNCGAKNSTEQNFCRACGLNLEDTSKSLLLQIPSAKHDELLRRERWVEKFGTIAWGGFGVVLIAGIGGLIYAVVTGMILSGKNPLVGILLTAFLIFAALTLIFVGFNEDLKEKKKKFQLQAQQELAEPKTTGKLLEEKPFVPASSVVEESTELLSAEPRTRKFE